LLLAEKTLVWELAGKAEVVGSAAVQRAEAELVAADREEVGMVAVDLAVEGSEAESRVA
jgi:hypothetical protein